MKKLTTLMLAGLLAGCITPPPAPPAPYRAAGGPPPWTLIIDDREVTFIGPDQAVIRQPKPTAIVGVAGEIYRTPRIGVNIVHAACSDTATGRTWPDQVQVDVDGRRFNGCGGQ